LEGTKLLTSLSIWRGIEGEVLASSLGEIEGEVLASSSGWRRSGAVTLFHIS